MSKFFTAILAVSFSIICCGVKAEVKRYPLPNASSFPIAQAVEVPAGARLIFHSGVIPDPADPSAAENSPQYWGNTEIQTLSVLGKTAASISEMGLSLRDVIKMNVFLVGVPELENRLDFEGFMRAYSTHFGTKNQPKLPARSVVQVAALALPGILVEVEVILAR